MNQAIYTIPIREMFEPKKGCPICAISRMLEERCIEYILGAAMMEPDVRIETNKYGFCKDHFDNMKTRKNRLAFALMIETHLQELEKGYVVSRQRSKKEAFSPAHSCFVCKEIEQAMDKILDNIFKLYLTDSEFKDLFLKQEYYCFNHYDTLCRRAASALNKKQIEGFTELLTEVTRKYLQRLYNDVHTFTTLFDYRNKDVQTDDNVTNSIERSIQFLTGD